MHNNPSPIFAQIRFEQVAVHYYSRPRWLGGVPFVALNELSLTVDSHNLAVIGPSGAGKSTLIELLFGLRQATSGEVYVCGVPLSRATAKQKQTLCQHIQLIPQEPQSSLNPYYTVRQILLEPLTNLGVKDQQEERLHKVLADVGLSESLLESNPQQLSVGQAQRVAIARALIVEPRILVADEPTSSLDPVSRKQVLDLLLSLQKRRKMRLILVTHDFAAAQTLCERVLVLNKGSVVESGLLQEIAESPNHLTTRALISAQHLAN